MLQYFLIETTNPWLIVNRKGDPFGMVPYQPGNVASKHGRHEH